MNVFYYYKQFIIKLEENEIWNQPSWNIGALSTIVNSRLFGEIISRRYDKRLLCLPPFFTEFSLLLILFPLMSMVGGVTLIYFVVLKIIHAVLINETIVVFSVLDILLFISPKAILKEFLIVFQLFWSKAIIVAWQIISEPLAHFLMKPNEPSNYRKCGVTCIGASLY